ncbi:hypothetical protein [Demequina soli]|uniref:hypothetical protein n=1 Tax=Demequina soli TaxID=1638987 RepID=UPI00078142F3|nr:hypothetical protein [Demequina soli]
MARIVWSHLVIALIGAIVALVGAGSHRAYGWVGLTASLLLVASASVFARAWSGFSGLGVMGAAWVVMTMVLAQTGPGGSVLIAGDRLGLTWVYGGAAVIAIVAVVPRRLLVGAKVAAS